MVDRISGYRYHELVGQAGPGENPDLAPDGSRAGLLYPAVTSLGRQSVHIEQKFRRGRNEGPEDLFNENANKLSTRLSMRACQESSVRNLQDHGRDSVSNIRLYLS